MSASHDRKFFDTFLLVLGILVGVTIGLIIVARIIAGNTSVEHRKEDPVFQQDVAHRIEPVARVAVAGRDNAALNPPAAAPAAGAAADLAGDVVFNQACVACHGAGVAGAPKLGDKADWAPQHSAAAAALCGGVPGQMSDAATAAWPLGRSARGIAGGQPLSRASRPTRPVLRTLDTGCRTGFQAGA